MSQGKQKYPGYDIPFPPGRFVLGDLITLQTKDNNGRDRKNPSLFVAVAIDKREPTIDGIVGNIIGYTRHTYGFVPGGQQVMQRLQQPNFAAKSGFAWKIKDGDRDPKWAAREGCPGHWIFCFGTSYAPARCCDTSFQQIDPRVIGLGDWVQVFSTVNVNGEVGDTAGIYLNPNGVMFLAPGPRIVPAGQSFEQMFGGRVGQLPPGAAVQQPQGGYAPQGQQQAAQAYGGQLQGGYAPQGQQQAAQAYGGQLQGGYAPNGQYPAGGMAAGGGAGPAQAYPGAGSAGHGGQQATAYPSNAGNGGYAPPAGHQAASQYGGTYQQPSATSPQTGGQPGTYTPQGGAATTAYPSNGGPAYQAPPGVQPNYNFVNGPQR